jgi:Flp pilus assembly protein CpaB
VSFRPVSLPRRGNLLSTRRGNLIIAAVAAAIAGILLVAFLHSYKHSLTDKTPSKVVVADRLIPKGASADVLASSGVGLNVESVAHNRLKTGALADAAALHGEVAARDIFPGEQITAADFKRPTDPLLAQVQGADRVITLPLDPAHGLVGEVHPGDHVDVLGSFSGTGSAGQQTQPFTRVLARNVLVLGAPARNPTRNGLNNNSTQTANITLRVSNAVSAILAYASDNGKVWLVLRPTTGALDAGAPARVTLGRVLANSTPVTSTTPSTTKAGKHH